MDLSEFETLVDGAAESQSLDFKGSCSWDVKALAKDILAFSNVQDGGFIVVGFDDKTFKRVGVSEQQAKSFNQEIMQDQMANYADPFVVFTVHNDITDTNGLRFVVIRVAEFTDTPVICRMEGRDTHQGVVYYRSNRSRPGSAPVSNAFDMRDILDRAVIRLKAKRKGQGYTVQSDELKKYYDEELGGL